MDKQIRKISDWVVQNFPEESYLDFGISFDLLDTSECGWMCWMSVWLHDAKANKYEVSHKNSDPVVAVQKTIKEFCERVGYTEE